MKKTLMLILFGAALCSAAANQLKRVDAEVLALFPQGFRPQQIVRPEGKFILAFNNRTGLDDISIELAVTPVGKAASRVGEKRMEKGVARWTPIMDLPAGEYTVSVPGHPEWTCRIVITQK